MTAQEDFMDSVDQDQMAQNVQSYLWSTLSTLWKSRLCCKLYRNLFNPFPNDKF